MLQQNNYKEQVPKVLSQQLGDVMAHLQWATGQFVEEAIDRVLNKTSME